VSSTAELLPREADGQRWVALWVHVHNPLNREALLLSPHRRSSTPATFSYAVQAPGGAFGSQLAGFDSSMIFFEPLETKSWLFDFRVGDTLSIDSWTLTPGSYQMSGGYAGQSARYDTLTVTR
jgi:hypothetical protein